MTSIKSLSIGQISLDFERSIYDKFVSHYEDTTEFIDRLQSFITRLANHKDEYNINPSSDKIKSGIYILGADNSDRGIFPDCHLALKCSQNKPCRRLEKTILPQYSTYPEFCQAQQRLKSSPPDLPSLSIHPN